ncbi:LysR substrate-binding domain-containing protein, partial [Streptomyces sp. DH12]|uniref:LysR substrate-binding domain-containing protein n=1 Tax=Streptomyces sp. DH12 TaxID=2857010 RepID=UPI001E49FB5B
TSAGTAAGIDACLHLVRKEQGPEVANRIARRMVVPPHRDGGQAQYIERPLPEPGGDSVAGVLVWMEQHLDEEVTVEQLAARAKSVLTEVGALMEEADALRAPFTGVLRLGVIPTVAPYLLPTVLRLVHDRYPRLDLQVHEEHTAS